MCCLTCTVQKYDNDRPTGRAVAVVNLVLKPEVVRSVAIYYDVSRIFLRTGRNQCLHVESIGTLFVGILSGTDLHADESKHPFQGVSGVDGLCGVRRLGPVSASSSRPPQVSFVVFVLARSSTRSLLYFCTHA